jgi:hypothetical protein
VTHTPPLTTAQLAGMVSGQIEPTWESIAANYQAPDWLQDGKVGVWLHCLQIRGRIPYHAQMRASRYFKWVSRSTVWRRGTSSAAAGRHREKDELEFTAGLFAQNALKLEIR